jgi:hypothetical protein
MKTPFSPKLGRGELERKVEHLAPSPTLGRGLANTATLRISEFGIADPPENSPKNQIVLLHKFKMPNVYLITRFTHIIGTNHEISKFCQVH